MQNEMETLGAFQGVCNLENQLENKTENETETVTVLQSCLRNIGSHMD